MHGGMKRQLRVRGGVGRVGRVARRSQKWCIERERDRSGG